MMRTRDIETAAAALGNQLTAGISIRHAVSRLAQMQRKHSETWRHVLSVLNRGGSFSEGIEGEWPESLVNAVAAGEYSGELASVFKQIEHTMKLQQKMRKTLSKLVYPVSIICIGIVVFIFFMLYVLPVLHRSFSAGHEQEYSGFAGTIFGLSRWMTSHFSGNEILLAVIAGCVVVTAAALLKSHRFRDAAVGAALSLPVLKTSLSYMFFGLWARYVMLLDAAGGVDIVSKLTIPVKVLPQKLQGGVHLAAREAVPRGLADCVDPDKQKPDDPRLEWPYYIPVAFIVANETGRLDKELERVIDPMLTEGFEMFDKSIQLVNIAALGLAGFFITMPLVAYYIQLGASLQNVMGA